MEKQQAEAIALNITSLLLTTHPEVILEGKQKTSYPKEIVKFAKTLSQELTQEFEDIEANLLRSFLDNR